MMFIRKGMDYIFTQRELWAIDDILPHWRLLFCPPTAGEYTEENDSEPEQERPELNGTATHTNDMDEIEEVNEDEENVDSISFAVAEKSPDRETTL